MVPDSAREEQLKHINSIPYYVHSSELFLAVVPRCFHEDGDLCGESTWLQRGWCRTEMWCKLLQVSDVSDIPIIFVTAGDLARFALPRWIWYPVHSGQFTLEADRQSCCHVVQEALKHKILEPC